MKRTLTAATFAVATSMASIAFAQYQDQVGISPRIGLVFPSNASARDDAGRSIFAAGVDYKYRDITFGTAQGQSGSIVLSLDYYGRNDYTNIPILANYIVRNEQFYFGGGVGISFSRVPNRFGNASTNTNLGFGLTVGYDFVRGSTPLFVEAKYHGSAESRVNALGIYAGVRL